MQRIRIYADQTRNKQIAYDGTESYSDWVNTEIRTKVDVINIKEEYQTEIINKDKMGHWRKARCGGLKRVLGMKKPVFSHTDVLNTYHVYKRFVITDFDGKISYEDWELIDEFSVPTEEH